MKIGAVRIAHPVILPRMEEHTIFPFRLLMKQFGAALVKLVEEEFRIYTSAAGLRRLARTSCYFGEYAPDFRAFRDGVHAVCDLPEFRRLVRDHFR
jgi:hypothetical protein